VSTSIYYHLRILIIIFLEHRLSGSGSHLDVWLRNHWSRCKLTSSLYRLADRAQHDSSQVTTNELLSIEDWLAKTSDPPLVPFGRRRATTCAPLGEKSSFDPSNYDSVSREGQQPRSLRRLPFSQGTFEQICEKFQVHRSIVRAIARSDVPVISCDRVHMNAPAIGMIPCKHRCFGKCG
jgi:hypothetical protein